jgi:hypothetical protein
MGLINKDGIHWKLPAEKIGGFQAPIYGIYHMDIYDSLYDHICLLPCTLIDKVLSLFEYMYILYIYIVMHVLIFFGRCCA